MRSQFDPSRGNPGGTFSPRRHFPRDSTFVPLYLGLPTAIRLNSAHPTEPPENAVGRRQRRYIGAMLILHDFLPFTVSTSLLRHLPSFTSKARNVLCLYHNRLPNVPHCYMPPRITATTILFVTLLTSFIDDSICVSHSFADVDRVFPPTHPQSHTFILHGEQIQALTQSHTPSSPNSKDAHGSRNLLTAHTRKTFMHSLHTAILSHPDSHRKLACRHNSHSHRNSHDDGTTGSRPSTQTGKT